MAWSARLLIWVVAESSPLCGEARGCNYAQMAPRRTITSFGVLGESGRYREDGPAGASQLRAPVGVAVDLVNRVVYVADTGNHAVRSLGLNLAVTSRRAGVVGSFGAEGWHWLHPETRALQHPHDIVVDPGGRLLFISDTDHHVIRSVVLDAEGASAPDMQIVAGVLGQPGVSGDGGPAASAQLCLPRGLTLDPREPHLLYIADSCNHAVRIVDSLSGVLRTVAGVLGYGGASDDGGEATLTTLRFPWGVAVDAAARELYVSEPLRHTVRRVDLLKGVIATLAGKPEIPGFSGNGGPAYMAELRAPHGLAIDVLSRQLYVADTGNHVVRLIGPLALYNVSSGSSLIVTIAGSVGDASVVGDGRDSMEAALSSPMGLDIDFPARALFIAAKGNHAIRRVDLEAYAMANVAGILGSPGHGGEVNGSALKAQLHRPLAVALNAAGDIAYVADSSSHAIRKVELSNGTIALVAGVVGSSGCVQSGAVSYARIDEKVCAGRPFTYDAASKCNGWRGLTADKCREKCSVNEAAPFCDASTCVAAVSYATSGSCHHFSSCLHLMPSEGASTFQRGGSSLDLLVFPAGLALDPRFNKLYIADAGSHTVRTMNPSLGNLSVLAGQLCKSGLEGDGGLAIMAFLTAPFALALDIAGGALFIADTGNHAVRRVSLTSGMMSTSMGVLGSAGNTETPAFPLSTRLRSPRGVAVDSVARWLFVADSGNHVVRMVDLEALPRQARSIKAAGLVRIVAGVFGVVGSQGNGGFATAAQLHTPLGLEIERVPQWHLAMRVNGSSDVWRYGAEAWASCGSFEKGDDVKTLHFCTKFDKMRLVFLHGSVDTSIEYIISDGSAVSLRQLFANDKADFETAFGAVAWLGLLPLANLNSHCHKEGFHVRVGSEQAARCRFGFLTSSNTTCPSADSVIGLGCEGEGVASRRPRLSAGALSWAAANFSASSSSVPVIAEVSVQLAVSHLYIADSENHAVRRLSQETGLLDTVAGELGSLGRGGDSGSAVPAQLFSPSDVAVDAVGRRLFVADSSNHAIRMIVAVNDVRAA